MLDIDVDTRARGPLFDGSAGRILDRGTERGEKDVADYAQDRIRARLGRVLRNPTGRYMGSISVMQRGGSHEVNDRGIVYGPWLEGTSSRNRTTRFKGYATFRIVSQQVEARAGAIAEPAIDRASRRI